MLSKIVLSLGMGLALTASNASPVQAQATRSFSMGFTDYSHDLITEPGAWDQTARTVNQLGDLLVIHEEESVPWTEALANRPDLYHSVQGSSQCLARPTVEGHRSSGRKWFASLVLLDLGGVSFAPKKVGLTR